MAEERSRRKAFDAADAGEQARHAGVDTIADSASAAIAGVAVAADPSHAAGITISAFLARWVLAQILRWLALYLADRGRDRIDDAGRSGWQKIQDWRRNLRRKIR